MLKETKCIDPSRKNGKVRTSKPPTHCSKACLVH